MKTDLTTKICEGVVAAMIRRRGQANAGSIVVFVVLEFVRVAGAVLELSRIDSYQAADWLV